MTGDSAIMVRVASPPRAATVKAMAERRETGKWLGMMFETNREKGISCRIMPPMSLPRQSSGVRRSVMAVWRGSSDAAFRSGLRSDKTIDMRASPRSIELSPSFLRGPEIPSDFQATPPREFPGSPATAFHWFTLRWGCSTAGVFVDIDANS